MSCILLLYRFKSIQALFFFNEKKKNSMSSLIIILLLFIFYIIFFFFSQVVAMIKEMKNQQVSKSIPASMQGNI